MLEPSPALPVVRQCTLLDRSRSSVSYTPPPVSASDLALRRRIDERHLNPPVAGSRMRRDCLKQEGICLAAVEDALGRYGTPDIVNTDQGGQFTSSDFVDRLRTSVKYEEVYGQADGSVTQARQGLERYFRCYHQRRPHASLDGNTPDQVYCDARSPQRAA